MTVRPPASFKMPDTEKEFWHGKCGPKPTWNTPDDLWNTACEYFTWVQSTPLYEAKSYSYQGFTHQDKIAKMRAMTIDGFQIFARITQTTWYNYKAHKGFEDTIERIEKVIRSQKFEGAAAGLLNPMIVARELGLKESTENTNVNAELKYQDLTDDQLNAKLKVLLHAVTSKQI